MISSVDGEIYAYQTRLGIVCLTINVVGKKYIGCNRVVMKVAISSSISNHHIFMEEKIIETSLKEMFQRMHKNEFNERKIIKINDKVMRNLEEISSEGRQFLETAEAKKTKAVEHYVSTFFGRGLGDAKQKTTGNAEIDVLEKMV